MATDSAVAAPGGHCFAQGNESTRTVLWAMSVSSLPFLWQGGLPFLPLMVILAWWRLHSDSRDWRVPSVLMRALIVAPVAALVLATSGFGLGRPTGMLVASVWMKLVEMRHDHDHHVQVQFCLLLITAQMLAAIDPFSTAYATGSFLLCLVCLQRTADPAATSFPWLATVRHSLGVLAKALPVALVIFLLTPRGGVQLGLRADQARTGVSDTLQVGSIARLVEDDSRAFTVTFTDGVIPPREAWYWRGPVLWRVDSSQRWYGSGTPQLRRQYVVNGNTSSEPRWQQEILLEPHHQHWVFALDHPVDIDENGPLNFHAGFGLTATDQVDGRLAYRVTSQGGPPPNLLAEAHLYTLDLPEGLDPRVVGLARALAGEDARATALAVKAWFREQGFRYSRSPDRMEGDATADFLFNKRVGFCGHYATSFTLLLRAAGHPARVVVGYRGGQWNPYGKFIDVRQRNAHAWAEVYQPGVGWLRFDPTDDAIGGGEADETDAGAGSNGSTGSQGGDGLFASVQQIYDYIDRAWFRFVYSYDESMQLALLALIGLTGWARWLLPVVLLLGVALCAWLAMRLWPRGRLGRDPVSACWLRFCQQAASRGCARQPHEGPLVFAERLALAFPAEAAAIAGFARAYAAARYGRPEQALPLRELRRLGKQIRLKPPQTKRATSAI
jgi:transglutaminase-like putative cysteine protease